MKKFISADDLESLASVEISERYEPIPGSNFEPADILYEVSIAKH
jgi:hypothetical protein